VAFALARSLRTGETVYCGWCALGAPVIAEWTAREGFKAVNIDQQHGQWDMAATFAAIAALSHAGAAPVVRIPLGDFAVASRVLDAGAEAIIAPMINSAADARAFVAATKYPPLGERSWGPNRALALQGRASTPEYLREANEGTLTLAMIETKAALANVEAIAATPGLDALFIGPYDLAIALSDGAAQDITAAQLAEPMEPTDDDRLIANDVTATRSSGGSSARQSLVSGALSIQSPPNGVGPYPQTPAVNVATDAQLIDEAGWLVWLGTVDDFRYPVLSANLASPKVTAVYYQLQDLDIGDRIVVGSTPSWLPPDGISQLVQGQTEVLGDVFTEQWSCAPELPYRVGILDDPVLGHADTDGSTVHAGISATATSMQVDTTGAGSPLWTTSGGDFPFDIAVGGERMTVTNITGASSPQTFTVTRSVNNVVKTQTAGTDVRLWQPMILSM